LIDANLVYFATEYLILQWKILEMMPKPCFEEILAKELQT
jgi:hypothetical protein